MTLTPIEPTRERSTNGGVIWLCKCDCGRLSYHEGYRVRKGIIQSCGCSRRVKAPQKSGINMMYHIYKYNASKRDLTFNLSLSRFRILSESDCHYCGCPPKRIERKGVRFFANGIDRKNNQNGYSIANCVSCCTKCNMAKGQMGYDEFMLWINDLIAYRSIERVDIEYKQDQP